MAANPQKRQKKLQRRAARSKTKHLTLMREKSVGVTGRLAEAGPIIDCLATYSLWEQGMGWVTLSRALPNGDVAYAIFLIDRYCLGVKNADYGIGNRFRYKQMIKQNREKIPSKEITPATARRFVESAVEYAAKLGFQPHSDYHRARVLFGTIDPTAANDELEFGQGGQPAFIAGPFDNDARCRQIIATLERKCGVGNFHFTMPIDADDLDDDLELLDDYEPLSLSDAPLDSPVLARDVGEG